MQIEDALYSAYGTRQISTIYAPTNEYQVIMELLPAVPDRPAVLSMLYIRSSTGQLVPLERSRRCARTSARWRSTTPASSRR